MTRRPSASRSSSAARSTRGSRPRTDGKVDVECPQCATQYRIAAAAIEDKMECVECHRTFFPKTMVGKRAKAPDNTKMYIGLGGGALAVIVLFAIMSSNSAPPAEPPKVVEVKKEVWSRGTHPRTAQIVKWAQAIGSDNRHLIKTHSDLGALAAVVGAPAGDENALFTALQSHDATRYLRELMTESASLDSDAAMTAANGKAVVYVTPKPGTDDWKKNTRGELLVSFTMDGEQVKVTGWETKMAPVRNPAKPDPSKRTFTPNENIAKPDMVDFVDSTGTARKKTESQPGPVPHWKEATAEQQQMADKVVADILASAEEGARGGIFNRAVQPVQSLDDRKAVVPRVLNAMNDLYADVTANNIKISQLDRALMAFTGQTVGYVVEDSGDAAKDKAARESCVRQWFAFWWRYSNGDLAEFLDLRENLEEPLEGEPKGPL